MGFGQQPKSTTLHKAASSGDLAQLKRALGWDAFGPRTRDVNAPDKKGRTALINACIGGHADAVRALLQDSRVDVNKQTTFGDSAILLASWKGHVDVVRELLSCKDINVNVQTCNGSTALMLASYYGHNEVIETLKADPRVNTNVTNKSGKTAEDVAASRKVSAEVEEIQKLRRKAKKQKKKIKSLEQQLKSQDRILAPVAEGVPAVLNAARDEITELQTLLRDARDDQHRLETFGATKRQELDEVHLEVSDLREAVVRKDEEILMLRTELEEARQAQLNELERHSTRNEQVLQSLRKTLDEVNTTPPPDWNPAFREKELTNETEITLLRRELQEAREAQQTANADLQRALKQKTGLSQEEIKDVCSELEHATKDHTRIAQLEQLVGQKDAEIALLLKQTEELSSVSEELATELEKTKQDQAYIMELEVARKKSDGELQEMRATLNAVQLGNAELEAQVAELETQCVETAAKTRERVVEMEALRKNSFLQDAKMEKMEKWVLELESTNKQLVAQNIKLEKLVTEREEELSAFREEIRSDLQALRPSVLDDTKRMQALEKELQAHKSTAPVIEIVKGVDVAIANADALASPPITLGPQALTRSRGSSVSTSAPKSSPKSSDEMMEDAPAKYPRPTPVGTGQVEPEDVAYQACTDTDQIDEVAKESVKTARVSPQTPTTPNEPPDVKIFENGIKKRNRRLGSTDVTLEIHSPRKLLRVSSKGKQAKEFDLSDPRTTLEWKTEGKSLILTVPDPKTGGKKPMKFTIGKTNKPVKQQMITDAFAAMSECMKSTSSPDDPMSTEEFSDPNSEMAIRMS